MSERDKETATETFDSVSTSRYALPLPDPNSDYAYAHANILNFWPVRNSKGATYYPDDLDDDLMSTLAGRMVTLDHNHAKVVGTIIKYAKTDRGVEAIVEIDRDKAEAQFLDLDAMRRNPQYFSSTSIELTRDPIRSQYILHDEQGNVTDSFPSETATDMGLERTTRFNNMRRYQGKIVSERVVPKRFTGIALTSNPSDPNAKRLRMVASDGAEDDPLQPKVITEYAVTREIATDTKDKTGDVKVTITHTGASAKKLAGKSSVVADAGKAEDDAADAAEASAQPAVNTKPNGDVAYADPGFQADGVHRFPLDTPERVLGVAKHFVLTTVRAEYTPPELKQIDMNIAEAAKNFNVDISAFKPPISKETASMTEDQIKAMQAENARLKETATNNYTEVVMHELHAIHPFKNDAERTEWRNKVTKVLTSETAANLASDNDGVVRHIKVERENVGLKEVNGQLTQDNDGLRTKVTLLEASKHEDRPGDKTLGIGGDDATRKARGEGAAAGLTSVESKPEEKRGVEDATLSKPTAHPHSAEATLTDEKTRVAAGTSTDKPGDAKPVINADPPKDGSATPDGKKVGGDELNVDKTKPDDKETATDYARVLASRLGALTPQYAPVVAFSDGTGFTKEQIAAL